jgi:hypothetical protein
MINRDPLGERCEEILRLGMYGVRTIEISLWYTGKRTQLTSKRILNKLVYHAKMTWAYVTEFLQLIGLMPAPTQAELNAGFDRLRAHLADTRYDDDPNVQSCKSEIRDLLAKYDKSR